MRFLRCWRPIASSTAGQHSCSSPFFTLIQGKGYPDITTRQFLVRLSRLSNNPNTNAKGLSQLPHDIHQSEWQDCQDEYSDCDPPDSLEARMTDWMAEHAVPDDLAHLWNDDDCNIDCGAADEWGMAVFNKQTESVPLSQCSAPLYSPLDDEDGQIFLPNLLSGEEMDPDMDAWWNCNGDSESEVELEMHMLDQLDEFQPSFPNSQPPEFNCISSRKPPLLCLVDCDPHGLAIMLTYRLGSKVACFNPETRIPSWTEVLRIGMDGRHHVRLA